MILRLTCAVLVTALSAIAAQQQAQVAPQTFTISGTVVERASNGPLKDVTVTIASTEHPETSLAYRTGEDGRFAFNQLGKGKYSLAGRKRGFPLQSFQENQYYSTAIAVGPGLDSADIVFPLSRGGSITGTVLDEENEPVRQAKVMLFHKEASGGAEQILMQNQRATDSSGQFRFPDLKPGAYFISVQAQPWYAQHGPQQPQQAPQPGSETSNEDRNLDVAYPLTYYGGATDPAAASAINVAEGGTSNAPIVLRPVPALHVKVTGFSGKPAMGMQLMVMQRGLGGVPLFSNHQISSSEDQVEISGIAPGRYILSPQNASEHTAPGVFDLTSNESLDINAFSGNSLAGRIVFEGNGPALPHPVLFLHDAGGRMQTQISIAPDGALALAYNTFLLPGLYELSLQNAPGFYLKSVEAKGATVSGSHLDIPAVGAVQLSLVAAPGSTTVNGIALKDGKARGGALVLLMPDNASPTALIRRDQSDSDGTFTLPDVAPGRYKLLAIEDGGDLLYQDQSVIKPYLSHASELTAPLANNSSVKVEIQERQVAVH